MRSLGDHSWLNDYIGIPYEFGGRDYNGLDCYGLVKLVFQEKYGQQLPDWALDRIDLKGRANEIETVLTGGTFTEVDHPAEGSLAICYRTRAAHHLGIYFAGGILHCVDGMGVVFETVARFKSQYSKVVFGEWFPCP